MDESHALEKIQKTAKRIVVATEERTRVEHCRIEEFKKLLEQIGIIYDKITELVEMIMEQDEQKTGLVRVHARLDLIESRVNEIVERIAKIETSRSYQDKKMDITESRFYDFLRYLLPIIGGLMAGGGLVAYLK